MFRIPPLPPLEGMHPLVVHVPIGLLFTAPVFVVLAMVWGAKRREMLLAGLIVVAIGTVGAVAAAWTGEAGEFAAKGIAGADKVLHRHEDLAELARNLFIGVTVLMAVVTGIVWRFHERIRFGAALLGGALLLAVYAAPALILANAAHEGGRLVHEFGVRAPMAIGAVPPAGAADGERRGD